MEILLSNSSDKPLYEQITTQIKGQIMDGTLAPGQALPSMRALARDLRLSVITVQRAYEDLTRDGFLETIPGKGSFASAQSGVDAVRREELLGRLDDAVEELLYLGVTPEELKARIDERAVGRDEN